MVQQITLKRFTLRVKHALVPATNNGRVLPKLTPDQRQYIEGCYNGGFTPLQCSQSLYVKG